MPEQIEVILTWSDPEGRYLGSEGETVETLGRDALWELLMHGRRNAEGGMVTSVTIWPATPPARSQAN